MCGRPPAPGLIAIYSAESLLSKWALEYQFVLRRLVNDRVLLPYTERNTCVLVYGTRFKLGPAIESLEIAFNNKKHSISFGHRAVLLRTQFNSYLRNRLIGRPRPEMRPGGSPIQMGQSDIFPVQGTFTGKYGECLALTNISVSGTSLRITDIDFLDINHVCSEWTGCHHMSYFKQDENEVIAVDGQFKSQDWEVRIFSNI